MIVDRDTIRALRDAVEKCGGEGGTPGPCPLNKPKIKPVATKPSAVKPSKPSKKPKTLDEAVMPHFLKEQPW